MSLSIPCRSLPSLTLSPASSASRVSLALPYRPLLLLARTSASSASRVSAARSHKPRATSTRAPSSPLAPPLASPGLPPLLAAALGAAGLVPSRRFIRSCIRTCFFLSRTATIGRDPHSARSPVRKVAVSKVASQQGRSQQDRSQRRVGAPYRVRSDHTPNPGPRTARLPAPKPSAYGGYTRLHYDYTRLHYGYTPPYHARTARPVT